MNAGILAGIIFSVSLGVLGGAIGTYFSIKNTSGPRERAFMVRRLDSNLDCCVNLRCGANAYPKAIQLIALDSICDRIAAGNCPVEQETDGDSE